MCQMDICSSRSWKIVCLMLLIYFSLLTLTGPINVSALLAPSGSHRKFYNVIPRTTTVPPPTTTQIVTQSPAVELVPTKAEFIHGKEVTNGRNLYLGSSSSVTLKDESSTVPSMEIIGIKANVERMTPNTPLKSHPKDRVMAGQSEEISWNFKTMSKENHSISPSWSRIYGGSRESFEVLVRRKSKKGRVDHEEQKSWECSKVWEMLRHLSIAMTSPVPITDQETKSEETKNVAMTTGKLLVQKTIDERNAGKTTSLPRFHLYNEPAKTKNETHKLDSGNMIISTAKPGYTNLRTAVTTIENMSEMREGPKSVILTSKKLTEYTPGQNAEIEASYVTDEDKIKAEIKDDPLLLLQRITSVEAKSNAASKGKQENFQFWNDVTKKTFATKSALTVPKTYTRIMDANIPRNSMSRSKLMKVLKPVVIGKLRDVESFEKGPMMQEAGGHKRKLKTILATTVERPLGMNVKAESVEDIVINSANSPELGTRRASEWKRKEKANETGGRFAGRPSGVGFRKSISLSRMEGGNKSLKLHNFEYKPWDPLEVLNDWRSKAKLPAGLPSFSHAFFHDPINHTEWKVQTGMKIGPESFSHPPKDDVLFGKSVSLKHMTLPIAEAIEVDDNNMVVRREGTRKSIQKDRSIGSEGDTVMEPAISQTKGRSSENASKIIPVPTTTLGLNVASSAPVVILGNLSTGNQDANFKATDVRLVEPVQIVKGLAGNQALSLDAGFVHLTELSEPEFIPAPELSKLSPLTL